MYRLSGVAAGLLAISPVAAFDPIKGGVNVDFLCHTSQREWHATGTSKLALFVQASPTDHKSQNLIFRIKIKLLGHFKIKILGVIALFLI